MISELNQYWLIYTNANSKRQDALVSVLSKKKLRCVDGNINILILLSIKDCSAIHILVSVYLNYNSE